jgi:1-acyl-sn-glycerol-3-phosphate acyltransferase
MRPLYFFLKYLLKYPLWVYYPRLITVNKPKKRYARTIFASNHAASFMDPLVVAQCQPPIVFFMTRSDVFKPFLKPFLWASHMFPVYRDIDGEDTKKKNETVFKKCYSIIKGGRSLLMFSEGFTDDVFIRRLKPIKKGAIRIGFGALEDMNWEKKVYIQAVGVNYSDPNTIGSDIVISNSEPICLNNYHDKFKEDSNKAIHDLTKLVEVKMREQITDVRKREWAPTHEFIMRLTKKGMNVVDTDKSIPLYDRWQYSKCLADWMNAQQLDEHEEMVSLKDDLKSYFDLLKKEKVEEKHVDAIVNRKWSKIRMKFYFALLWPFAVLGLIHSYLPYSFIKNFVEKSFKRKVFWGSVKMTLGVVAIGLFNLIFVFLGYYFIYPSWFIWIGYLFTVAPLTGMIAYGYLNKVEDYRKYKFTLEKDFSQIAAEREELLDRIYKVIPVA